MNNNSFYGGRDGRPLIITEAYDTIYDMLKDFAGYEKDDESIVIVPENTENIPFVVGNCPMATKRGVNFGDYVIIKSENKNNPENGRIFRRGFNFNDTKNKIKGWSLNTANIYISKMYPCYGAEYISQIVGPSGNAPHLHLLSTISEVENKYKTYVDNFETALRNDQRLINNLKIEIKEEIKKEESFKNATDAIIQAEVELRFPSRLEAKIKELTNQYNAHGPGYDIKQGSGMAGTAEELGNLVAGKEYLFNEETGEPILDENNNHRFQFNDNIKWHYCSVRDENQQETDAYIGFEIPYTVIEWESQSENPYYNRNDATYDENGILIEGTETNDFINTGLITRHNDDKDAEHPFYQKWQIHIPKGIHGQSIEELQLDDNTGKITYNIRNFDKKAEGDATLYTLNENNPLTWITGATLNTDNGQLDIDTNNGKNEIHTNLTWVKDINLSDSGYLDIDTTTGKNETHEQLQWVKNITFNTNGTVVLHYIDGTTSEDTYENLIDWIKSIHIAQNGTVTVVSNNGTDLLDSDQVALQWIDKIALAENGKFTYGYNTEDSNEAHDSIQIKWPTNIKVNNNGTIETEFNNGDPVIQGPTMNWITSAELTNDKKLSINYVNTKNNIKELDLKTVNNITFTNGSMYADYNDGTSKQYIGSIDNATVNMIAGDESIDTSSLRIGGIWFEVIEG